MLSIENQMPTSRAYHYVHVAHLCYYADIVTGSSYPDMNVYNMI